MTGGRPTGPRPEGRRALLEDDHVPAPLVDDVQGLPVIPVILEAEVGKGDRPDIDRRAFPGRLGDRHDDVREVVLVGQAVADEEDPQVCRIRRPGDLAAPRPAGRRDQQERQRQERGCFRARPVQERRFIHPALNGRRPGQDERR